jgi:type I restriction enzyme, S subunit
MAGEFPELRLGDLVDQGILVISDGYRVRNEELGSEGIPFVRGGDIGDGWINTKTVDHIRPEFAERVRAKITCSGDAAFITKGTVGRAGRLRPEQPPVVFAPQVSYWRVRDLNVLDPGFIFYLISSRDFQLALNGMKTHGAMVADYVSISQQYDFRLRIPDIGSQRAIADILGTLDDKIELNRQMNETLEAIAQAIFKSWFVDFDPVRAKMEGRQPAGMDAETAKLFSDCFQAGVLPIPSGWRQGALGEIAESPRRAIAPENVDPDTPYIGLEHMPRRSIALGDWDRASEVISGKSQFFCGEILFGKLRPYFHKVGVASVDGVCSTDILVMRPKESEWFGFVLGHASSVELINWVDAASTGTKMPRTNWADISRFEVAIPPQDVAEAFNRLAKPMVTQILSNIAESRTLAAIRDALLPKLLSGEVRVGEAGRVLEAAT